MGEDNCSDNPAVLAPYSLYPLVTPEIADRPATREFFEDYAMYKRPPTELVNLLTKTMGAFSVMPIVWVGIGSPEKIQAVERFIWEELAGRRGLGIWIAYFHPFDQCRCFLLSFYTYRFGERQELILQDTLENITRQGNPWGQPRADRGAWLEWAGIKAYREGNDYLLYLGCLPSYDDCCREAAAATAGLLSRAGVSFGALGGEEDCDGNEVRMLGEDGLLEHLARGNIERFREMGVDKVITISPHSYNAMRNEYPELGMDFEVYHYTQVLRDLVSSGRIVSSESAASAVTYHDPCFLGRYNGIYDEPRRLLTSIPGLELKEMIRGRERSYCCGGGSGGFCADYLGGAESSPSRSRLREARDTGAGILAVACPACLTMMEDALAAEGLEEEMAIEDASELLAGAVT